MASPGGLIGVLLGGLIGLVLVALAIALFFYGLVKRDLGRTRKASIVSLTLSLLAALVSTPFWIVVISGHDTRGEPLRYDDASPIYWLVFIEGLAIAAALFGLVRQLVIAKRAT
jgi:hypothetical protein